MPVISTSFSATAKPFLVESDSRIFRLLQKFNLLESLQLQAMHINDSAWFLLLIVYLDTTGINSGI